MATGAEGGPELDGRPCPPELLQGVRFAFIEGVPRILGSPCSFARCGASGAELSELLPQLSEIVDDFAIVKSMHTTQFNHAPAQIFMNTGHQIGGRPSIGSWLTYGLGSETEDLPGFVVLRSGESSECRVYILTEEEIDSFFFTLIRREGFSAWRTSSSPFAPLSPEVHQSNPSTL